jgi:hypothetical protein
MLTMKITIAIVASAALLLALAGCSSQPQTKAAPADAKGWSCTACRSSEPTNTATPIPMTVIVPDASKDIATEVAKMQELGLQAVVLDATGNDVTSQFSGDYAPNVVFVSQEPAGGTEVDDGAAVTVKVRDPKTVVSADFSGPGGSISMLDGTSFSQVTGAPQHWEKEVPYGDNTDYTFTNPYAAGTLTCKVTEEGEVMQTNTASGPFASTNC